MNRVQIIGLPGAGKTTAIHRYLDNSELFITHIDIQTFPGLYKAPRFKSKVLRHTGNVIAESACGIYVPSYIIKLEPDIQDVYQQLLQRDGHLDEDYLSLLTGQMVPAHCTITLADDLSPLLDIVFNRRKGSNATNSRKAR